MGVARLPVGGGGEATQEQRQAAGGGGELRLASGGAKKKRRWGLGVDGQKLKGQRAVVQAGRRSAVARAWGGGRRGYKEKEKEIRKDGKEKRENDN